MHDLEVSQILRTARDRLAAIGISSSRLDAEVLLAHVLGVNRTQLLTAHEDALLGAQVAQFEALVSRRLRYEPIAYLVGEKEFYSRDFYVTSDVLIPRPETEGIVDRVLQSIPIAQRAEWSGRILDLGTGSGCLAITLASLLPKSAMVAVDLSEPAIAVAKKNAHRHGVSNRIAFVEGDMTDLLFLKRLGSFDVVVSNPPYISDEDYETLLPDVRLHEPKLALVADEAGLYCYRHIAEGLKEVLSPNGTAILEIGDTQGVAGERLFAAYDMHAHVDRDYAGQDRYVVVKA